MKSIILIILFAMTVMAKQRTSGGDPVFDVSNSPHPFKRSVGELFGRRHVEEEQVVQANEVEET